MVPVYRWQPLAQLPARLHRCLAQGIEHLLLAVCRRLLLGQRVAGRALHRLQAQRILAAEGVNRARNIRFATRVLAKVAATSGQLGTVKGPNI